MTEKNKEAPGNSSCKEEEADLLFLTFLPKKKLQILFAIFSCTLFIGSLSKADDCIGGVVMLLPDDEKVMNLTITTSLKGGAAKRHSKIV